MLMARLQKIVMWISLIDFLTPTVSLFLILEIRYRIQELLKKNVDVIHGPLPKDAMIRIDREVPLYES